MADQVAAIAIDLKAVGAKLVDRAGFTDAVVKTSVVESWPQVTSKRLSADLLEVAQGSFAFSSLERLLPAPKQEQDKAGREQEPEQRGTRPKWLRGRRSHLAIPLIKSLNEPFIARLRYFSTYGSQPDEHSLEVQT